MCVWRGDGRAAADRRRPEFLCAPAFVGQSSQGSYSCAVLVNRIARQRGGFARHLAGERWSLTLRLRLRVRGLATHASRRTSAVSTVEKFLPRCQAIRCLEAHGNVEAAPLVVSGDITHPIVIGIVREPPTPDRDRRDPDRALRPG